MRYFARACGRLAGSVGFIHGVIDDVDAVGWNWRGWRGVRAFVGWRVCSYPDIPMRWNRRAVILTTRGVVPIWVRERDPAVVSRGARKGRTPSQGHGGGGSDGGGDDRGYGRLRFRGRVWGDVNWGVTFRTPP